MRCDSRHGARHWRNVRLLAPVWAAAFTLLWAIIPADVVGQGDSSTASRFLSQPDQPLTGYRAIRRMHAWSERLDQEAWLDAWTEQDDRGFRYEIVSESGSDLARNKVLKTVLRREQELIAAGHSERATLSPDNYEFTDADNTGDGLRHILLKPKRKDVLLLDGRMVLTEDATELVRVEGRLSKNPSFWTSSVNVVRHYGRLDGVRVPISTESIAKIRFAGISRLEVEYDYESINGRPLSLSARRMIASLR
jgi:hypothetical protein